MRSISRKLLACVGIAVVAVTGVVLAVFGEVGAAVACVLIVQVATGLLAIDTRRRQNSVATRVGSIAKTLKAVRRDVVNVSARIVSESSAVQEDVKVRVNGAHRALDRRADLRLQDVEAMFQLYSRFELRGAMPAAGRWALEPNGLLRIVDLIARRPIQTIVELGSGTSTLWSSYALEKRGTGGRIISLDHDEHFAAITREVLEAHGFSDGPAEVRDAPLVPDVLEGHLSPWYDPQSIEDITSIDLLLVDGPPEATGHMARYPAVPVLLSRLAPGAIVVVDDAARPEETAMVERWLADVPGLRRLPQAGEGRQILLVVGD
jgi:predicted O-methyltransferase YrrM